VSGAPSSEILFCAVHGKSIGQAMSTTTRATVAMIDKW
jgi:hypothetical protein